MKNKALSNDLCGFRDYYASPVGNIEISADDTSVCAIRVVRENDTLKSVNANGVTHNCKTQLEEYFSGRRKSFSVSLAPAGTPFQKSVWNALSEIPFGETRSYKQIAAQIGNNRAYRAVGLANNRNPIPIVIPCHRVLGSDGGLVGYAYGLDLKRRLLLLENAEFSEK